MRFPDYSTESCTTRPEHDLISPAHLIDNTDSSTTTCPSARLLLIAVQLKYILSYVMPRFDTETVVTQPGNRAVHL